VRDTPAAAVAQVEGAFFPGIHPEALTAAVARYQEIGCWQGDLAIPRALYDQAIIVFQFSKRISQPHPYDEVVYAPPAARLH
jgi:hypothetical protein